MSSYCLDTTHDVKLNCGEMLVKVGSLINSYGMLPLKLSTIIVMFTSPSFPSSVSHNIHSLQKYRLVIMQVLKEIVPRIHNIIVIVVGSVGSLCFNGKPLSFNEDYAGMVLATLKECCTILIT